MEQRERAHFSSDREGTTCRGGEPRRHLSSGRGGFSKIGSDGNGGEQRRHRSSGRLGFWEIESDRVTGTEKSGRDTGAAGSEALCGCSSRAKRAQQKRHAPSPLLTLPYPTPPSHHNYASVPSSSFALDLLCSHLVLSHLVHALRFDYVFLLGAQQRCNAHALTTC